MKKLMICNRINECAEFWIEECSTGEKEVRCLHFNPHIHSHSHCSEAYCRIIGDEEVKCIPMEKVFINDKE